jgi:hypothetical protein
LDGTLRDEELTCQVSQFGQAGVVDEDVDGADVLHHPFEGLEDVVLFGDVAGDGEEFAGLVCQGARELFDAVDATGQADNLGVDTFLKRSVKISKWR